MPGGRTKCSQETVERTGLWEYTMSAPVGSRGRVRLDALRLLRYEYNVGLWLPLVVGIATRCALMNSAAAAACSRYHISNAKLVAVDFVVFAMSPLKR